MAKLRRGFKTWCENAARGFRRELGLSPFDALDPFNLAHHLQIPVWSPDDIPELDAEYVRCLTVTESDCWSALTMRDGPHSLIIVNSSHQLARVRNSLAHELSHVILRHEPPKMMQALDGAMIMTDYDAVQEEEASTLGGALLVPREALLNHVNGGFSDEDAANYFGVSLQLIRQRKNTTGIGFQLARRGTWRP